MKLVLKRSPYGLYPTNDEGKKYLAGLDMGMEVEIELDESCEKEKTPTQRGALHVWFGLLAQVLNEAGFTKSVFYRKYAKEGISIPWSGESIKEDFYKPTLAAMTGKGSTEDMNTVEPSQICEIVGHALQDRLGITPPPWPTRFNRGECRRGKAA